MHRLCFFFSTFLLAMPAKGAPQTEADGYTRYELLAPASGKFRILYEISATAPGATTYFNPIRAGSEATDERVIDRATGRPLQWDVVHGTIAAAGGLTGADPSGKYIRVKLARPVPADGGEGRVLIDKTYEDRKSYFEEQDKIVFDRPLGVKRNAVVLPLGYELVSLNYPAQVLQEADGRIAVSFWNVTPAPAPLRLVARRSNRAFPGPTMVGKQPEERARQSREIVYYLNDPSTSSFALTHDYTEVRPGTARYVNVVRRGSSVADPSARNLDTGEALTGEIVRGSAVAAMAPEAGSLGAEAQAVVFSFAPVKAGESIRLRISETYTDPSSYRLQQDGSLEWRRTLGRPSNAVVLPPGWTLVSSSIPTTVEETADGRSRLNFFNPRPDELDVRIVARSR